VAVAQPRLQVFANNMLARDKCPAYRKARNGMCVAASAVRSAPRSAKFCQLGHLLATTVGFLKMTLF
jgi:hypothetical protein